MGRTKLDFAPVVGESRYLTLIDLSQYNQDVPVTNAIYRITIPNFNKFVDLEYVPGAVLNVNSNLLRLTNVTDPDDLAVLPAGLYTIRQSVCPNDKLFCEQIYFNIEPDLDTLAALVCEHKRDDKKLSELYEVLAALHTVQLMAKGGCAEDAVRLYNITVKKITSLTSDCC